MASSKQLTPLWFRLLRHQRARRLTGFTPSFLIGAALPEGSIAALYERKQRKPRCEAVLDHNGEPGSLYAERQYFASKELSIDSLADGLWRTFGHPLVSAEYSIRDNCAFNAADRELIAAAQE